MSDIHKKRGRPATGKTPIAAVRLPDELREAIDKAISQGGEPISRSEYIRQAVEADLVAKGFLEAAADEAAPTQPSELQKWLGDLINHPPSPTRVSSDDLPRVFTARESAQSDAPDRPEKLRNIFSTWLRATQAASSVLAAAGVGAAGGSPALLALACTGLFNPGVLGSVAVFSGAVANTKYSEDELREAAAAILNEMEDKSEIPYHERHLDEDAKSRVHIIEKILEAKKSAGSQNR